ncbi:beta-propeller fold lactonase family protein [Streptomyces albireticuli]|uniref:beta-propeller fold lactonase family protein n=1 Tax=Streptomyces albireticuli TaxID=1940 RepID=UPI001475F488|nr:beta-propeller fold lactonase family protein [Streptomyces albireticuli]MCD9195156.1 beta-propeller fold lactonase family protein [Streptomyces albireticuli]
MFSIRRIAGVTAVLTGIGATALGAVSLAQAAQPSHPTSVRHGEVKAAAAYGKSVHVPISGRDRVYTADQTSNTVTVIDPSTGRTLGTIALGVQRLGTTLSPQYTGNVGVHGLAFSRDHKRLGVVSVTSNTVDIIDTATNKVISETDVGRASHEGTFTADGEQFWVADRGRDTVTVVDAVRGGVVTHIKVGPGPSKVVLSPDGRTAYVNHISASEITAVDVRTHRIRYTVKGLGDAFSSDEAISPDGTELWASHKRAGLTSVVDLRHRRVTAVLKTGPDSNHPNFADTRNGSFAYLTVGGLDQTLVYHRNPGGTPRLATRIHHTGHAPHGMWPSGDGTRMYVGMEKSDTVDVIDTATNKVTDTMGVGKEPQALVYVPDAAPAGSAANLGRQGLGDTPRNVPTTLPDGTAGEPMRPDDKGRRLEATVRTVSGLGMIQLQARDLRPTTTYRAYAVRKDGAKTPLLSFTTDSSGNAAQVLAFADFTGVGVSLTSQGKATAQTLARMSAAATSAHHGSDSGVEAADLLYCDCC